MTNEQFMKIANLQLDKCKSMLGIKFEEYTREERDRLQFFKSAAELQHVTTKQAIAGMMAKHTVSVYDMCAEGEHSLEKWEEKISDSINYLLLLRAIVEEERVDGTDLH